MTASPPPLSRYCTPSASRRCVRRSASASCSPANRIVYSGARTRPARVLLVRDVVAAARVLEAQSALTHRRHDLRLAARDPALRARRRQAVERVVRSGWLRKIILLYHEASPGRSIFSSAHLLGSTAPAFSWFYRA